MHHGAAHPTATGALLDHPGADHEWLHLQSHDVLEEKLVRDKGFFRYAALPPISFGMH